MKRRILVWTIAILIVAGIFAVFNPQGLGFKPHIEASAAVLLDMETGGIWVDVNGDKPMPPASMSKLMTEMVVMDCISSGKISWNERVPISKYASTVGGRKLSLKFGEFYTVRELFEGIAVYSANDAAVALAEYTAGSENSFVHMMNNKARSLGLSMGTVFANASGLPMDELGPNRPAGHANGETMMIARDAAKLAAALINTHPEVLNISSRTQMQLKGKGLYVSNSNLMLPDMGGAYAYPGNDGLKTGYDSRIGYCMAGTAQRNGHRLIAVVMGAESNESRFVGAAKLFDYGFYRGLSYNERFKHIVHVIGSVMG